MSHVATISVIIKDLSSLKKACDKLGLELMIGQKKYKWWGTSVGDFPLPDGYTAEDLGKCEHAIRVKGKPGAYEIGVVPSRKNPGSYELLWDFYAGGQGLEAAVGKDAQLLSQRYSVEVAKKAALRAGMRVKEVQRANGTIILRASK